MATPDHGSQGGRRWRWRLAAGGVAGVLLLAVAPSIAGVLASSWLAAAIRESPHAGGALDAAEVEVQCRFSWFATQRVEVAISTDPALPAGRVGLTAAAELRRGMGSLLFSSGPLPLEIAIEGEAVGPLAGDLLERWRASGGGEASDATPRGAASGPPRQLQARGTVSLRLLDETRGIDLAIRTDRLEVEAGSGAAILVEAAVGRMAEWPQLPGRVRGEAAIGDLRAAAADPHAALARTAGSFEARDLSIEWQGRAIELERGTASLGGEGGSISMGVRLEARIDGDPAEATADLTLPQAATVLDAPEEAIAAIFGHLAVAGLPCNAVAAWLPESAAAALRDLGETIDATLSLPPAADAAVTATLRLPHLEASAEAVLDRTNRSVSAGRVSMVAMPSGEMVAAFAPTMRQLPAERVRVDAEGADIEVASDGRWRLGRGRLGISDPIPFLAAAAATLEVAADPAELSVELADASGDLSGDLAAISGRLRLAGPGAWRWRPQADRPIVEVADLEIEAFAEPLGASLSLRGNATVDGAVLSIEQRIEGLRRGPAWSELHDLRPHGRIELAGLVPDELLAWFPDAASAFDARAIMPSRLLVVTRAEGDRLVGTLRADGSAATIELGLGLDSQRVLVGPGTLEATLPAESLSAAIGDLDAVEVLGDLPLKASVAPLVLPPLPWPSRPSLPRIEAALEAERATLRIGPTAPESPGERVELAAIGTAIAWTPETARLAMEGSADAVVNGRPLGAIAWKVEGRGPRGPSSPEGAAAALELTMPRFDPQALPAVPAAVRPALELLLGGEAGIETAVRWDGSSLEGTVEIDGDRLQLLARLAASGLAGEARAIEATIDSFEAALPPQALRRFLDEAHAAADPRIEFEGPLRASGAAAGWRWSSAGGLEPGELSLATAALPVLIAAGDAVESQSLPAMSIAAAEAAVRGTTAIEIASVGDDRLRASLRWRRGETAGSWGRLGGTIAAEGIPTALLGLAIDDGGLLGAALGESVSISVEGDSIGGQGGRVAASLRSPFGSLDLPQLRIESGFAAVPKEQPLQASLVFRPELRRTVLSRLNPIFADIERTDGPLRLAVSAERLPLDGDRATLDADLRLECGSVRIKPGLALSLPLAFAGDASAGGFDGLVEPLVATIRGGVLRYEGFTARFVRSGDSWRQSLVFSGTIDLAKTPPYAEAITTTYPGANLAKFSSELRRLPPELLEALSVPVTFYGPMGEGERLQHRIDLDPGELLRRGAETAIPGLIDRFLRPR